MNHLHVATEALLSVIRATPMVESDTKEYVIKRLRQNNKLRQLRAKTVNSFVLSFHMGILRGDPRLNQDDLQKIIEEIRNLDKLPLVPASKE